MATSRDRAWADASLAPPRRLGEVLSAARVRSGDTLADVAARAPAEWSLARLASVERGSCELDDRELASVAVLYGLEMATMVPARSRLVVDLDEGVMHVDGRRTATTIGAATDRSEVLARYLAMVHSMRNTPPGAVLALRAEDLGVLGSALGSSPDSIAADLDRLMRYPTPAVALRHRVLRRKVLLPAAGLLVAFAGAVALVLVPPDPTEGTGPEPTPTGAGGVTVAGSPPEAVIGTAVVQERLADGSPGPVVPRTGADEDPPAVLIDPATETR